MDDPKCPSNVSRRTKQDIHTRSFIENGPACDLFCKNFCQSSFMHIYCQALKKESCRMAGWFPRNFQQRWVSIPRVNVRKNFRLSKVSVIYTHLLSWGIRQSLSDHNFRQQTTGSFGLWERKRTIAQTSQLFCSADKMVKFQQLRTSVIVNHVCDAFELNWWLW